MSLPAHVLLLLLWFSEWVDGEEGCGKLFGVRGGKWGGGRARVIIIINVLLCDSD